MGTRKTGDERREEIIAATGEVLLKKGLSAATTRDVTGRLGVGVGLLSHYFSWSELRAIAFERIVVADAQLSLDRRVDDDPPRVMEELVRGAFVAAEDPVWRLWIEASDLAATDERLAARVAQCTRLWQSSLARVLERGNAKSSWHCADPEGAAWRLLALYDGLVGLVMMPNARLSRTVATDHLATVIGYECRPVPST